MRIKHQIRCKLCNKMYDISVDEDAYRNWQNGEGFIQDIMPELSPGERELLISQICDNCFSMLFGLEEEE